MSKADHTPGPWTKNSLFGVKIGDGSLTAQHTGFGYPSPVAVREANARLISAAPELLAALEAIIRANDSPPGATMGQAKVCEAYAQMARAALAKAKGAP